MCAGPAVKLHEKPLAGTESLDESDGSGTLTSEYVFFGGKRIARRDIASGNIYYYEEDMLGSSRTLVQAGQTSLCYDADFYPFGGEMTVTDTCDSAYKFTGKERDSLAENGNLDNFGARYDSSSMGRFMSPDPGPWILLNPQSYNAYSYALNNPIRYGDEDGMTAQDRVDKALKLATMNIPYVSGGHSEKTGLDCAGLVADVWQWDSDSQMNLTVNGPNNGAANEAAEFQANGEWSKNINDAQPGDAIFFSDPEGNIVHTGIVVDVRDGKVYFVHAPKPKDKVKKWSVPIKGKSSGALGDERFAGVGRSKENAPTAGGGGSVAACMRLAFWLRGFGDSSSQDSSNKSKSSSEGQPNPNRKDCLQRRDGTCVDK